MEPYLFLGLSGLTMLELALRSLRAPDGSLILASGKVLSRSQLPSGPGSEALFSAILHAIRHLREAALSDDEVKLLRKAVLHAEGVDVSPPGKGGGTLGATEDRSRIINRAASMFQRMAI